MKKNTRNSYGLTTVELVVKFSLVILVTSGSILAVGENIAPKLKLAGGTVSSGTPSTNIGSDNNGVQAPKGPHNPIPSNNQGPSNTFGNGPHTQNNNHGPTF